MNGLLMLDLLSWKVVFGREAGEETQCNETPARAVPLSFRDFPPSAKKSTFKKPLLVAWSTAKLLGAGLHHRCSDKDQEAGLDCELLRRKRRPTGPRVNLSTRIEVSQFGPRHVFNTWNSAGLYHGGLHLASGGHCAYV